ncbi:MAG: HslU--HslV peptidase proteolytic subunit, partial [Candidatus Poribacteria bacterium]|nr:HslU--HslV peptidase proteolytic subunit [Candidatus Poribacteria bacterium]
IDSEGGYLISGAGDVISPDDDVLAIGSGGSIALAAAKALLNFSSLSARDIVQESLKITSRICIYSNDEISIESIES